MRHGPHDREPVTIRLLGPKTGDDDAESQRDDATHGDSPLGVMILRSTIFRLATNALSHFTTMT